MIGLHIKKKHYYKSMKKLWIIILIMVFSIGNTASADMWDYFGDQNSYGQKAVTDEEFDKALESKMKKKRKNKNIPKGEEFHQSNETQFIKETEEELPVLCIPAELIISESKTVSPGHYQVIGEKINGKPVLKLYQAHYLIGEIPAIETKDDFNQPTVQFVKLINNGEKQVKIIFGSLDFNAYSIINTTE